MKKASFRSFDGTCITYYASGKGQLLMLLNGLGGSTYSWERVMDILGDEYSFTAWDYRGLFESCTPEDTKAVTVRDSARDFLALMDHLSISSVDVLAWSYGAQVALEVYRMAPERLKGIFFLNPVFGRPLERVPGNRLHSLVLKMYAMVMKAATPVARMLIERDVVATFGKMAGVVGPAVDMELFRKVASHFVTQDHFMYARLMAEADRHDGRDVLPHLAVPTMVVLGANDPFVPVQQVRKEASVIPDTHIEIIPDSSHYTAMEYPEAVARMVRRFVQGRVPA